MRRAGFSSGANLGGMSALVVVVLAGLVALVAGRVTLAPEGGHPMHSSPASISEDDLVDVKKAVRLEGPCKADACTAACKQLSHVSGRCDADACVCRDLKSKGRCGAQGCGDGGGGLDDGAAGAAGRNNINNNNILVMH